MKLPKFPEHSIELRVKQLPSLWVSVGGVFSGVCASHLGPEPNQRNQTHARASPPRFYVAGQ